MGEKSGEVRVGGPIRISSPEEREQLGDGKGGIWRRRRLVGLRREITSSGGGACSSEGL